MSERSDANDKGEQPNIYPRQIFSPNHLILLVMLHDLSNEVSTKAREGKEQRQSERTEQVNTMHSVQKV